MNAACCRVWSKSRSYIIYPMTELYFYKSENTQLKYLTVEYGYHCVKSPNYVLLHIENFNIGLIMKTMSTVTPKLAKDG